MGKVEGIVEAGGVGVHGGWVGEGRKEGSGLPDEGS